MIILPTKYQNITKQNHPNEVVFCKVARFHSFFNVLRGIFFSDYHIARTKKKCRATLTDSLKVHLFSLFRKINK